MHASDEMYIPCLLSLGGVIKSTHPSAREENHMASAQSSSQLQANNPSAAAADTHTGALEDVQKRRVTYCDWSASVRNPVTFHELSSELIEIARKEGCLFLRKLKLPTSTNERGGNRAEQSGSVDSVERRALIDWARLVLPSVDAGVGGTSIETTLERDMDEILSLCAAERRGRTKRGRERGTDDPRGRDEHLHDGQGGQGGASKQSTARSYREGDKGAEEEEDDTGRRNTKEPPSDDSSPPDDSRTTSKITRTK